MTIYIDGTKQTVASLIKYRMLCLRYFLYVYARACREMKRWCNMKKLREYHKNIDYNTDDFWYI